MPDVFDNCPTVYNPDQLDSDGDGYGDACTLPANLILTRARLRGSASATGRPRSSIFLEGFVNANAPYGALVEGIMSGGLSLRVRGGGAVDEQLDWNAGECATRNQRRGPDVICRRPNVSRPDAKVTFRATNIPNVFEMRVVARRRTFRAPLQSAAVTVSLASNYLMRRDAIGERGACTLFGRSQTILTCRESGFVP